MGYKITVAVIFTILIALWISKQGLDLQAYGTFKDWALKHGKIYTQEEQFYRYMIFARNLLKITEHNILAEKGQFSYTEGLNYFSDLTTQEYISKYLSQDTIKTNNAFACSDAQPPSTDIPDSFDWFAKSAVTSVRNQGSCKSGYAFAASSAIQSSAFIITKALEKFSAQQIIDCSKADGNDGCLSGNALSSFAYIIKNGIASQHSYPDTEKAKQCAYTINMKAWEIMNCVKVTPLKVNSIKAAVYYTPLVVSINAEKLQNYKKGVYKSSKIGPACHTNPNHWMLMVGYGYDVTSKLDYWKLKNSFGPEWGQAGYLYIVRDKDGEGQCGVQNELYYPK